MRIQTRGTQSKFPVANPIGIEKCPGAPMEKLAQSTLYGGGGDSPGPPMPPPDIPPASLLLLSMPDPDS